MSTSGDLDFLIRTGSNSSNKKSSLANANQDVISNLPECIVSRILSSLPTQDAVRTSVLSKAWEFKWTCIYNINVEEKSRASKSFLKFVDRLLSHSQYIKNFCLACSDQRDCSHIENWISSVFLRNVETVAIRVLCSRKDPNQIVLPRSLFICSSLKELRIVMACILKVPARISFPSLTSLHLHGVEILTETDTVRLNLPVLQTCELRWCCWSLNVKCVEIYAPALTRFLSHTQYAEKEYRNYTIKIDPGVKLAHFEVNGGYLENFLLTGSQVVTAVIRTEDDAVETFVNCELRFRRLLNEFSSIEQLTLSCVVAQAIAQRKLGLSVRKYDKLVRLKLRNPCSRENHHHSTYDGLLELLHAAPYLKFLSVQVGSVLRFSNDGAYDFDAVVSVPSCIVSHLEEVTLCGLRASERHLELAKFLLKNGSKLKKFYARVLGEFKDEVEDALLQLPKGSQGASIVTLVQVYLNMRD